MIREVKKRVEESCMIVHRHGVFFFLLSEMVIVDIVYELCMDVKFSNDS